MAKRKSDYTEILVRKGVISAEQLAEATQLAGESGTKVADALTRLSYASGEDVMRAMAEQHGLDYVNLNEVAIPPSVVELVPESVARENVAIPLGRIGRHADADRKRPDRLRNVRQAPFHPQSADHPGPGPA